MVQLREKHKKTRDFVDTAARVHGITRKYNVPLIINDRVDIALAIDAEGIHVGQDDMDVKVVRQLVGPNKIVGLSVGNVSEAQQAGEMQDIIDYVGIGAVFSTATKSDAESIGMKCVADILDVLPKTMGTVAIGGINQSNVSQVYDEGMGHSSQKKLDGVAVVSAIMLAENVGDVVAQLKMANPVSRSLPTKKELPNPFYNLKEKPFVHHVTNNVVKNFSANVTIAIGGSPAMSELVNEFAEFAQIPNSAVLVNMGTTASPESATTLTSAVSEYKNANRPVVVDPVAAGASDYRLNLARTLCSPTSNKSDPAPTVIKGNVDEIMAVAGKSKEKMRGVDSSQSHDESTIVETALGLASDIVVVTGKIDYVVDTQQKRVMAVGGGHALLGEITGSGCSLGSVIASSLALAKNPSEYFERTYTAVAYYKQAALQAASHTGVRGPGTFLPAFIDELYLLRSSENVDAFVWEVK